MHRAEGDRLVRAGVLPVRDNVCVCVWGGGGGGGGGLNIHQLILQKGEGIDTSNPKITCTQ